MPLIFIALCSSELAQRPFHLQAKWSKSRSSQVGLPNLQHKGPLELKKKKMILIVLLFPQS